MTWINASSKPAGLMERTGTDQPPPDVLQSSPWAPCTAALFQPGRVLSPVLTAFTPIARAVPAELIQGNFSFIGTLNPKLLVCFFFSEFKKMSWDPAVRVR